MCIYVLSSTEYHHSAPHTEIHFNWEAYFNIKYVTEHIPTNKQEAVSTSNMGCGSSTAASAQAKPGHLSKQSGNALCQKSDNNQEILRLDDEVRSRNTFQKQTNGMICLLVLIFLVSFWVQVRENRSCYPVHDNTSIEYI